LKTGLNDKLAFEIQKRHLPFEITYPATAGCAYLKELLDMHKREKITEQILISGHTFGDRITQDSI